MRIASYVLNSRPSYGVVKGSTVVDLPRRLSYPDIISFIAGGAAAQSAARRAADESAGDFDYDGLQLLPVVPAPGKIICIGINYEEHRAESGRDRPKNPTVFARFPESQTAHRQAIVRARRASTQLDYEAELLVVIGQRAPRYTPRSRALEHVFGYSCYNESCHRDWQFHTDQVTAGKNFESTGASGPWITTADEIPDPQTLKIELRLNGATLQSAHTSQMMWPVDALIEYVTSWLPLNPGDLIVSGTPSGVGFKRQPPVYMKPGDVAEVEIEKIGVLRNPVVDEG